MIGGEGDKCQICCQSCSLITSITRALLPKKNGEIIGFLIGFLSQSHPDEAYIHFVGVHPEHREQNVGKELYERFFSLVKREKRSKVRCVTSPINTTSIAFHTKIGFEIEKGNKVVNGVAVHADYDGLNQDRVLFVKRLTE